MREEMNGKVCNEMVAAASGGGHAESEFNSATIPNFHHEESAWLAAALVVRSGCY
jgi:hypothetical protein